MQKLGLTQTQKAQLSPKQLQFIQMLQVPTQVLLARIREEIANNPTLEQDPTEEKNTVEEPTIPDAPEEYAKTFSYPRRHFRLAEEGAGTNMGTLQHSWHEKLLEQISLLSLSARDDKIARYLVGSLSTDGYLRTDLQTIIHSLSFTHYLETDTKEVEKVLRRIQCLEPLGIGARNLREYLLLQLEKKEKDPVVLLAIQVLTRCFVAFSKKNYRKIKATLKIEQEDLLKKAILCITQLSPQPIVGTFEDELTPQKKPDFIVRKDEEGELQVDFYHDYVPHLRVRRQYREMLEHYHQRRDKKSKEVARFVKENIQRAQWFIESIQKRRDTLLRTMGAIVRLQKLFFEEQDEQKLRPLFMRHIAEEIEMDISTVSRVVRDRSVATDFGVFPLKYFFSEPIATTEGGQASSRTIKGVLKGIIDKEDRRHPYTDEELVAHMKERGYILARRTVAKYRAQLHFPVARMRKEL